jgi:exopolysaccharide biosynthesis polyprenyl glycosylphosphotransferase
VTISGVVAKDVQAGMHWLGIALQYVEAPLSMFPIFNLSWPVAAVFFFCVDLLVIIIASGLMRGVGAPVPAEVLLAAPNGELVLAVTCLIAFYRDGLYDVNSLCGRVPVTLRVIRSFGAAYTAVLLIDYGFGVGLGLANGAAVAAIPLLAWRMAIASGLRRSEQHRRILLIGTGKEAEELAQEILARPYLGYRILGFLGFNSVENRRTIAGAPVLGCASEVVEFAREQGAKRVVVAVSETRGKLDMRSLLECKTRGIVVEDGASFYERLTGRIQLDELRTSGLVFGDGFVVSSRILAAKRILDLAVSGVALAVLAPLLGLIAAAVKLDSRGPVFYRQERVGFRDRKFLLWKFRSMRVGAERDRNPRWAQPDDDRVTRVGAILRRFSLDELPQLWNILRGEMSLVGPRPEREHFVDRLRDLSPLYQYRLAVRPGLTGWAQIMAPYASSYEHSLYKLSFDLYYLKKLSVIFDLAILAGTARVVFFGRPERHPGGAPVTAAQETRNQPAAAA